jgi:hypothetical protein
MKAAFLSESAVDERVLHILTEAVLGEPIRTIEAFELKSRGWPFVRDVLPAVIKSPHYRTDADLLVVLADSNHSPPHVAATDNCSRCRRCLLRTVADQAVATLTPVPTRRPPSVAIGLAVPAIEAWLLCGQDPNVSERAWFDAFETKRWPYSKDQLKAQVYGVPRPSQDLYARRGQEEARRLAQELTLLEQKFPLGFGRMATELRNSATDS